MRMANALRLCKISKTRFFVLLGVLAVTTAALCQVSSTLEVNDPRPLAAWADQMETITGMPVNYEDARYSNPSDVVDVTSSVVLDVTQHPNIRVLIPRGGTLGTNVALTPSSSATEVLATIQSALSAHTARGFPGIFAVRETGGAVFVEPSQVRDASGAWGSVASILESKIAFPSEKRTIYETLQLILTKVTSSSGFTAAIGSGPIALLAANSVTLGSNNQTARDAVIATLKSLKVPISYRLFYDPTLKLYAFNLHLAKSPGLPMKTVPTSFAPPGTTTTSGVNPWFDKAAPAK